MMEGNQMHVPEGWNSNELGKLIIEGKKSALKVSDAANFGQYPFFTSGEAVLEHVDKLTDGENIYLATGGIANIKFFDGDASYSTDTYAIRANDEIETKYLYFDLLSNIDYINANYFQGSGLKHLQKKDFKKHTIQYPKDTTEQRQITTILSKVDEAISQTDKLIAKYSRIKTGLMQDLLTKGIDEHGNIRSEATHKFKDSPLGRIPVEWKCVKLSEIGSKNSPYLKTGPFGSSLKTEHWQEIGVPVVTIGALGDTEFIAQNLLYISEVKAKELSTYRLLEGDLLFSRVADIGRSLVIKKENAGWVMSSNFMRLRLDKEICLPEILYVIIKYSYAFKKQISENVNESGRSVTNSKTLNAFLFPNIPSQEQKLIVNKQHKMDESINSVLAHHSKLQSIKTGLMQDLLRGKVRVNHLIKETTNV